ncbi:Uncharacterised protein r2_g2740 [Pycnogonum litorale]
MFPKSKLFFMKPVTYCKLERTIRSALNSPSVHIINITDLKGTKLCIYTTGGEIKAMLVFLVSLYIFSNPPQNFGPPLVHWLTSKNGQRPMAYTTSNNSSKICKSIWRYNGFDFTGTPGIMKQILLQQASNRLASNAVVSAGLTIRLLRL